MGRQGSHFSHLFDRETNPWYKLQDNSHVYFNIFFREQRGEPFVVKPWNGIEWMNPVLNMNISSEIIFFKIDFNLYIFAMSYISLGDSEICDYFMYRFLDLSLLSVICLFIFWHLDVSYWVSETVITLTEICKTTPGLIAGSCSHIRILHHGFLQPTKNFAQKKSHWQNKKCRSNDSTQCKFRIPE